MFLLILNNLAGRLSEFLAQAGLPMTNLYACQPSQCPLVLAPARFDPPSGDLPNPIGKSCSPQHGQAYRYQRHPVGCLYRPPQGQQAKEKDGRYSQTTQHHRPGMGLRSNGLLELGGNTPKRGDRRRESLFM